MSDMFEIIADYTGLETGLVVTNPADESHLATVKDWSVAETEAAIESEQKARKSLAGLRLGFFINVACWVFGMIVFAAISFSDADGQFEMLVPAIWWTVGMAGFGLTVVIVELATRYRLKHEV